MTLHRRREEGRRTRRRRVKGGGTASGLPLSSRRTRVISSNSRAIFADRAIADYTKWPRFSQIFHYTVFAAKNFITTRQSLFSSFSPPPLPPSPPPPRGRAAPLYALYYLTIYFAVSTKPAIQSKLRFHSAAIERKDYQRRSSAALCASAYIFPLTVLITLIHFFYKILER